MGGRDRFLMDAYAPTVMLLRAGDAGFEHTSPAPKAGRISRLPQSPNSIQMASLFEVVGANEELLGAILRYLNPKMG